MVLINLEPDFCLTWRSGICQNVLVQACFHEAVLLDGLMVDYGYCGQDRPPG